MGTLLRGLFKALLGALLVVVALALAGIAYGWASRGLLITTDDVQYAYPQDHPVQLPRDLAAHPDFKTEWWYWTGHLKDDKGHEYGFELVFFHTRTLGVWRNHLPVWWFMKTHATAAQFAVIDKATGKHVYDQRVAVNSKSDVGAATDAMHAWTYDWFARQEPDTRGGLQMHLKADNGPYAIDLMLRPEKPAVLHGEGGLMRREPYGVTSNYISYTRLAATGTLRVDGTSRAVTGLAWHDHEYASGKPAPQTAGWDWMAIQFDNPPPVADAPPNPLANADLMLYQVRSNDGIGLEGSKGTFVGADGSTQALVLGRDFTLKTGTEGTWTSPGSGGTYPLGWHVELPARGWTLDISPVAREQELLGGSMDTNYWEGASTVVAHTPQGDIRGVAYVELCGYDRRVDKF